MGGGERGGSLERRDINNAESLHVTDVLPSQDRSNIKGLEGALLWVAASLVAEKKGESKRGKWSRVGGEERDKE